ncbi:hypothetical protein P8452_18188 [Trifolium repens]|nr:hypothetical protein P8452_18188 [Trifolium repens]
MCPLRFILVFFSTVLAGYSAWRTRSGHRSRKSPPTIISITVMLDSLSQRNFMHRRLNMDLPFCRSQGEGKEDL